MLYKENPGVRRFSLSGVFYRINNLLGNDNSITVQTEDQSCSLISHNSAAAQDVAGADTGFLIFCPRKSPEQDNKKGEQRLTKIS